MYTIYVNNTLLLALPAREFYRAIFGPPVYELTTFRKVSKAKTGDCQLSLMHFNPAVLFKLKNFRMCFCILTVKGDMQVHHPTSKPFCPVLSTIGERGTYSIITITVHQEVTIFIFSAAETNCCE